MVRHAARASLVNARLETAIPPGSTNAFSRAEMLTPSPMMSFCSTTNVADMDAHADFDAAIGGDLGIARHSSTAQCTAERLRSKRFCATTSCDCGNLGLGGQYNL